MVRGTASAAARLCLAGFWRLRVEMQQRALVTGGDDSSQDLSPCCMPGTTPDSRGSPLEPSSTVMETGDHLVHPPQGLRARQ